MMKLRPGGLLLVLALWAIPCPGKAFHAPLAFPSLSLQSRNGAVSLRRGGLAEGRWSRGRRKAKNPSCLDRLVPKCQMGMEEPPEYTEDEFPPWQSNIELLVAAKEGDQDLVSAALAKGVDLEAVVDEQGRTCLHYAVHAEDPEMVNLLLSSVREDCRLRNKLDRFSGSALHIAAERGHQKIVRSLLKEMGSDDPLLLQGDVNKYTALHYGAENGHLLVVQMLAERGGQSLLMAPDLAEQTALHCAAFKGHIDVVKYLVQKGGVGLLMHLDFYGESARDSAIEMLPFNPDAKEVVAYLKGEMDRASKKCNE